ncbi:MAG: hypothetical protein AAGA48_28930 [Myxococcota bacterium]
MRNLLSSLMFTVLGSGCFAGNSGGQWYVIQFNPFDLTSEVVCTENFADLSCFDALEPEDGPVVETTTEESGLSLTVLLLDQGHDCPTLVVDDLVVLGEVIEDGYRYNFDASEATDRNITDPSTWASTYREQLTDTWSLTLTKTDDKGVFNASLSETYELQETGSFTDQLDDLTNLQSIVPDPFFWPLGYLVFVGEDPGYYYDDGYAPDEDDCDGPDCTFSFTQSWTLEGTGSAKLAADLAVTDDVDPTTWGQAPGVGDEPFWIGTNGF